MFNESEINNVRIFSSQSSIINIDRLFFFENKINEIILSGVIKKCEFWGNVSIAKIHSQAEINTFLITKTNYRNLKIVSCEIGELSIIEKNNTEFTLHDADFKKFIFVANRSKSNITVRKCVFHEIIFENNFDSSIVFISTSSIRDSIIFKRCEVSQLILSNLDLSRTRFILLDSFLNNFRWHHVKWASNIKYFKNEEDTAYDPLDTLRLLKQNAIKLEDVFCKINFQQLEFSSITDRIRGSKWNNWRFKKLKWIINPFRDFYLIFHKNNGFHSVDKCIFYLNGYSNNHGLNPLRGVLFTLGIGLMFFMLYVYNLSGISFQWGWSGFSEFGNVIEEYLPHFCKFLYPGHRFDFMAGFNPNSYASIFDLLGRIFIGYGYYQIVRSFRKYSK
ncbi:hypothetical protein [Labilibaculum manganireducens]|uniref:hypothetical protein n=1 Tax=Labilibaculum manganireducens TaxID=1940525 RepID=UPI0029F47CFD|nr:hypothetical protein [Labilibaculum manganireducens]